jgi:membrane-associated phospholipid phosphatase
VKREIPLLISMVAGIFVLIGFFVPHPAIRTTYDDIQQWVIIVVAFTYVLGMANLLRINLEQIIRRSRDWPYKIALVGGCVLTMVVGLFFSGGMKYLNDGTPFSWIYATFYSAMSATMFSLLAFFIASAAFRAFRVRTPEALLLAIAAFILMLGRVPIGNVISPYLPLAADWLMEIPQNAAKRGILMGAALGVMATGFRVILGIEKTYGSDGG